MCVVLHRKAFQFFSKTIYVNIKVTDSVSKNELRSKKIEMIYDVKKGWYIYEYEDNKKEYMYIINC